MRNFNSKKSGKAYENIVASIAQEFYPDATVKIGVWINGPDGEREVDVEVKGTRDGKSNFTLIECKDWGKPVDIQEIDKLDSKRKDLEANQTVIVSNSGFSAAALRKCSRVRIQAASAIMDGESLIRTAFHYDVYAKFSSVESWKLVLFVDAKTELPKDWKPSEWGYKGLPILNWISDRCLQLLSEYEDANVLLMDCLFNMAVPFERHGKVYRVYGMHVEFLCSRRWALNTTTHKAAYALWDYIEQQMIVPQVKGIMLNIPDTEWIELAEKPLDVKFVTGPLVVGGAYHAIGPVERIDGVETPPLESIIQECIIDTQTLSGGIASDQPLRLETTLRPLTC